MIAIKGIAMPGLKQITPLATASLILLLLLTFITAELSAGVHSGYVYARQIITNDQGHTIWAKYNPDNGEYTGDIGPATGDLKPTEWRVLSGAEYSSQVALKNELHNAQPDLLLMSRTDYQATDLLLVDVGVIPVASATKPELGRTTAWVSIIPQARRLIDDPASIIQGEYSINPDETQYGDYFSMLHKYAAGSSDMGKTKNHTNDRIGMKVAFAVDSDGNPMTPGDIMDNPGSFNHQDFQATGPVAYASIELSGRARTATSSTGRFGLFWPEVPCPGFFYVMDNHVWLELHYTRFNPRSSRGMGLYMDSWPTSEICNGVSYTFGPFGSAYPSGNYSMRSFPDYRIPFILDLSVFSGTAQLSTSAGISLTGTRVNLGSGKVHIGGETQYQADAPDNSSIILTDYDFDRDGNDDTLLMGHYETIDDVKTFVTTQPENLQAVWLSSSGTTPGTDQPDFTRVTDSASFAETSHQGLLSQVSEEDLRNTDIYIVRVSDGKLISERIGLNEYEGTFNSDTHSNSFYYNIEMQGSVGDRRFKNSEFENWQATSGVNPELHQRASDHLKPGDLMRIYAINRTTGYIGHVDTTMSAGDLANGDIGFRIDPIIMGPPNLKIRAERGYKIEKGATASDDTVTRLIGFEGASLTSDTTVTITTEWLDHNGHPLPPALEGAGYTGRIAILSGNQTLPSDNQGVYQFAIEPGQRLQVLQLPNRITDSEHFYIHINGEPQSGNPIFAGSTDGQRHREADFSINENTQGILAQRPGKYVPFLVPIYDEEANELQTQAYRTLRESNPELAQEKPDPIYRWVYRPEMQFSSYDLTVNEIKKGRDADDSGTIDAGETINILNDETPLITSDSMIDILYGLSTTELLPLDYFNAGDEKELIFIIGEQEVRATIGADQTLTFDDLSHLNHLNPDDFLTIRLVTNNDMGNVLWEWAFMNLDIDTDSDNNNGLALPDRSPEEEAIDADDTKVGKVMRPNTGDEDEDGIPNFAEFDVGAPLAPMVLLIPEDVDISIAKISLSYASSAPNDVTVDNTDGEAIYEAAPGFLRLWKKNGDEIRNPNSISIGGDFVKADTLHPLNLFDINSNNEIILYMEAIRVDEDDQGQPIKVRLDRGGV
jgi:hypothetical protein